MNTPASPQPNQPPNPWADVFTALSQDGAEPSTAAQGETSSNISYLDSLRVELGEISLSDAVENANNPVPKAELIGQKPEQDAQTRHSLEALKTAGLQPRSIYYPASETRVTIAGVFPDARVIFGEVEPRAIEALQDGGYEVLAGDMHTTELPQNASVDLVYMRYMPTGTMLSEKRLKQLLVPGGYFVTDNEFGQADRVRQQYGNFTEVSSPDLSDVPEEERLHLFQLHQNDL